jgi:hypothetical protein
VSFAIVGALAALVLSAAGLIGDAPPATASATASAPASRSAGPAPAPMSSAAPSSAAPSDTAPSDSATPTAPPSSGTPSPPPQPLRLDRLPTGLVTSFPLTVSGSGTPGDVVAVSAGSSPGSAESCQAPVGQDGRWRCAVASLPDGPGVPVRAESRSTGAATSGRVDVLRPPVIVGGGAGGGAGGAESTGSVHGTAYPNARVTVTADTGATCTCPADSAGSWACVLSGRLPDGRHTVTATQVAGFSSQRSAVSSRVAIQVDRTAPAAPTITTPAPGTVATAGSAVTFGGSGETGGHVTVYATTTRGTTVACSADVVAGAWSCQGALPEGGFLVSALQRDAAGNVSAGSNSVAVTVTPAAAPSKPSPSRTPSPSPTPTVPAPAVPGGAPPPSQAPSGEDGWFEAPFTTASAPVVSAAALPGWIRSVALAVAALLLLVLPGRLLAAALSRRRAERGERGAHVSVFGRNRPRSDVSDASPLFGRTPTRSAPGGSSDSRGTPSDTDERQPLWLVATAGAATILLVTLSAPVPEAGAYPSVLLAVAAAVAAVNAVWVLAGRGLARHLRLAVPRLALRPGLLVVVAATALGSRLFGLSPALLFALVLSVAVPHAGRVRRGRIAAVQVSAVAALGVLAWLAVGLLAAPADPFGAFLLELANALALVGIGSAAVMLLPVGGLAGRAIVRWSRWLWAGLSLVVYTVLFALLLPVASLIERGAGVLLIVGVAAGFAAASVAVWLWERFVAPALDRTVP